MEIFVLVRDYELYYEIGNLGTVKSTGRIISMPRGGFRNIQPRILKPNVVLGYQHVILQLKGKCQTFKVHRLVAIHFIPNPNHLPQINHLDGNKLNNAFWNLEWCTAARNMRHAVDAGLRPVKTGFDHPIAKQITNLETGEIYPSVRAAADQMNVHVATLSHYMNKLSSRPISKRLQQRLSKLVWQ